eukprot:m.105009 g.105009  ORF g.105009 m.105009 type:complete len:99 (+) comp27611_c0_seq1:127-423(+)
MEAADPKEFEDFKQQLTAMQIDKSRLRLLKAWLSDHAVTCTQAVEVLKVLFGLGDVAVQAAVLIHPKLVDPQHIESVLLKDGFQYNDERQEAKEKMGL